MGLKVVTVHLPEAHVEALDELVRRKRYPNRAEAIRTAVRDFLLEEFAIIYQEEERKKEEEKLLRRGKRGKAKKKPVRIDYGVE